MNFVPRVARRCWGGSGKHCPPLASLGKASSPNLDSSEVLDSYCLRLSWNQSLPTQRKISHSGSHIPVGSCLSIHSPLMMSTGKEPDPRTVNQGKGSGLMNGEQEIQSKTVNLTIHVNTDFITLLMIWYLTWVHSIPAQSFLFCILYTSSRADVPSHGTHRGIVG